MQSSEMASSLWRHLPKGRVSWEGPKSVRSKIMTLLLWKSCMCMAEMPTDLCRRVHSPPPGVAADGVIWEARAAEGVIWDGEAAKGRMPGWRKGWCCCGEERVKRERRRIGAKIKDTV